MAIQPLAALPIPPLATDSEAVFNAKTDATLLAEKAFVDEMNAATIPGINQAVIDVASGKDAAATSAGNAANSANLAGQKVGLAADQVALAVTARQAAQAALASTVVVAAAAQSAAGMPSLVGHGGQALCAKLDETGVEFKSLSQAIGDVLETTRTPDATYLLPDTIYTRAAYPDLFAIVGTQGANSDGANLAVVSTGLTALTNPTSFAGANGVVILVGYTGGTLNATASYAARSTDGGLTWAPIATLNGIYGSFTSVETDGAGVWVIASVDNFGFRSTDNGVSWSAAISMPGMSGATTYKVLKTNKVGTWLCINANSPDYGTISRSTNNGLTWVSVNFNFNISNINVDTVNNLFYTVVSTTLYRSADGLVWATVMGGLSGAPQALICNAGIVAFHVYPSLYISVDKGISFKAVSGVVGATVIDSYGIITASMGAGNYYRSVDNGETWTSFTQSLTVFALTAWGVGVKYYTDSNGVWLLSTFGGSSPQFHRSTRLFNYDISTQFKTPAHKAPKGYKAYIKGKLV